jgi:hypothetical protein
MLDSINKRLDEVKQKLPTAAVFIERARLFAMARSGKIIALKVPEDIRAQVEAIRVEHGLKTYTEAVHFVFAMGLFSLRGGT